MGGIEVRAVCLVRLTHDTKLLGVEIRLGHLAPPLGGKPRSCIAKMRVALLTGEKTKVPNTREVWVTLPNINSLAVISSTTPALTVTATIKLEGSLEGYALDAKRGLFYTNLEDGNLTLAIDIKTRKVKTLSKLDCGDRGPRGVAVDSERNHIFVACTNGLRVLDGSGKNLSTLGTGEGVDSIDYLPSSHTVLVASAQAAEVFAVEISAKGEATLKARYSSAAGCRTVLSSPGVARLPDSRGHRVVRIDL